MHKFLGGAEGRTDARRQNPAGETHLPPHPRDSAKEPGPRGYAFEKNRKTNPLAASPVKPPWAPEEAAPILASAAVRLLAPGTRDRIKYLIFGTQD